MLSTVAHKQLEQEAGKVSAYTTDLTPSTCLRQLCRAQKSSGEAQRTCNLIACHLDRRVSVTLIGSHPNSLTTHAKAACLKLSVSGPTTENPSRLGHRFSFANAYQSLR